MGSNKTSWDVIVDGLEKEGVKYVFGLPGNPAALYDSLYDSNIESVLVRHEASGAFMAYAYGKIRREPGVCFGSPGPGVANMTSGVLEAYSGCVPMLILGSSSSLENKWKGAFQEAPQMEMFRPITKWSYQLNEPKNAGWAIRRSFTVARNGKPGPIYLDIPFDKGQTTVNHNDYIPGSPFIRVRPETESVKAVADLLLKSERPVILAGGGAHYSNASKELIQIAELLGIPVLTTPCGRGIIPETHPLAVGLVGLYRTKIGKRAYQSADLLISLGSRNEEFQTHGWRYYPEEATIVQVDIDSSEIGKNWPPDIAIVSDVKLFLRDLSSILSEKIEKKSIEKIPRIKKIATAKQEFLNEIEKECHDNSEPLKTKRIVYEANKVFGKNTILVNENGSQDLWSYYYPYYRVMDIDGCVAPAEQTCMGLGVVGAIGAKLAAPDKKILCTTGDGAFQMVMQEISTAVQYNAPVTWIILNNYSLGWIKLHQWANSQRYISVDYDAQPDFSVYAEACNCYGEQVKKPEEITPALNRALQRNKENIPAVLDFIVDPMDFPDGFKEFHPHIFP
jgi:acetolactate synthase-1/2/3 large subunit